ncbi:hypothetical protein [Sphingopyxis sp.]|uniref:hypothetical protein n=1 Tax=Sphingopyxis sp. TaxID=1908224 RepID=UPI003F72C846
MSRRRPPWSSLGIDPTGDERTIKRAYAKKLKAIDVEAEPAKFIALRRQYDDALWQARWVNDDDHDEDDVDDGLAIEDEGCHGRAAMPGGAGPADATAAIATTEAPPIEVATRHAQPWLAPEINRIEARFAAIEQLLWGEDAGRDAAIDRETRALWDDPALESVDAARDAEYRLAQLVLDHGVAARFLLRLASWHYGWARRAQLVGTEWPVSEVGPRAAAENWIARVEQGEVYNQPKTVIDELERAPSGRWWRDYYPKRRIAAFLGELRQRFPEGEYRFDPDVVDAWDAIRNPGVPWGSLVALLPLSWVALFLIPRLSGSEGWDNPILWGVLLGGVVCVVGGRWAIGRLRSQTPTRYGGPLSARQAAVLAAMLGLFAVSAVLPAAPAIGIGFALAVAALLPFTGARLPRADETDPLLLGLFNARYLVMAAGLFGFFAIGEAPHWSQAVAPGLALLIALHLLRERLVASWEALPGAMLSIVRAALLIVAVLLCGAGIASHPHYPELAVLAGVLLLLAQDSAANAWRAPLSSEYYFAYIVLMAVMAVFPLQVVMAMVVRRLSDRLINSEPD